MLAVCVIPGAPALIPELMGAAASELDDVRLAARSAMAAVAESLVGAYEPGPGSDSTPGQVPGGRLVVVGVDGRPADDRPRAAHTHDLAEAVDDSTFGRTVDLLPLGAQADVPGPTSSAERGATEGEQIPTPLLVARRLAADVSTSTGSASVWHAASWVTLPPEAVDGFARELVEADEPVGLVVVADGAACHGSKAPRAEDPRAEKYDDEVCRALASADQLDFDALDPNLGQELGAEGADLWPLLAAAAAEGHGRGDGWRAELVWRGAPYGVGWFVATWLR